jgi:osmotically-inducible protein OsmY
MERHDSHIQAAVHQLLERRWIDLSRVTLGTTNGVVYIEGELRPLGIPGGARGDLTARLRREIEEVEGVREVVLVEAGGGEVEGGWTRMGGER